MNAMATRKVISLIWSRFGFHLLCFICFLYYRDLRVQNFLVAPATSSSMQILQFLRSVIIALYLCGPHEAVSVAVGSEKSVAGTVASRHTKEMHYWWISFHFKWKFLPTYFCSLRKITMRRVLFAAISLLCNSANATRREETISTNVEIGEMQTTKMCSETGKTSEKEKKSLELLFFVLMTATKEGRSRNGKEEFYFSVNWKAVIKFKQEN